MNEMINASRAQMSADMELVKSEEFMNSLSALCENLSGNGLFSQGEYGTQLSQTDTLFFNNRWYLISNLRQLLSQMYVEHGIVQTLVDQPVDDAYRAGFEIKSSQLEPNDIEKLIIYMDSNQVIDQLIQARKWARLYGGGGVIIMTNTPAYTKLNINNISPDDKIGFRSCDMWELFYTTTNVPAPIIGKDVGDNNSQFYDYYGYQIHESRVLKIVNKEAPAFIKPRLRGWGMSELERLVRSLNQYMKNQDVIFELLDEAKIDVMRVQGFNSSLMTNNGTNNASKRIQMANMIKNYNHALIMDKDDEYEQKQITFAGLAEMLKEIRLGIAADLKMPVSKIFGVGSTGFSSGEDDIENYNSMLESEIRKKDKYLVVELLKVCCQKIFGFIPDDLMIEWNPLRILNAKEEEEVKNSQFNRVMSAYTAGLATPQEAKQAINKDSLFPGELDETSDALPPVGIDANVSSSNNEKVDKNK